MTPYDFLYKFLEPVELVRLDAMLFDMVKTIDKPPGVYPAELIVKVWYHNPTDLSAESRYRFFNVGFRVTVVSLSQGRYTVRLDSVTEISEIEARIFEDTLPGLDKIGTVTINDN
jgi:hypothetical protein